MAVQCVYGWSDKGGENGDGKEGSEISGVELFVFLYVDDLVLCGESEEELERNTRNDSL